MAKQQKSRQQVKANPTPDQMGFPLRLEHAPFGDIRARDAEHAFCYIESLAHLVYLLCNQGRAIEEDDYEHLSDTMLMIEDLANSGLEHVQELASASKKAA